MSDKTLNLIKRYEDKIFCQDDLKVLNSINSEELIEILTIENKKIRNFLTKAYFTTYNEKTARLAENDFEELNFVLSEVWVESALREKPESIISAFLGITFFSTDFLSRIRSKINSRETLNAFEKQVYETTEYLRVKFDNNMFLDTIFSANTNKNDDDFLKCMDEKNKLMALKIKSNFEFILKSWDYYFSVVNKNEDSFLKTELVNNSDKEFLIRNILPSEVSNNIKKIFEKDDEIDFSELINLDQKSSEIKINEEEPKNKADSVIKSEKKSMSKSFDTFKKGVSKNKKRNFIKNKKPEKRGNGRLIFVSVLIILAISLSMAIIVDKKNQTQEKPFENIILADGLEAKVTIKNNEKEEKKEEKK